MSRPSADYELDRFQAFDHQEGWERLRAMTDELGARLSEVASEVASNRAALPGATEKRVRARVWKYTR